MVIKKAEFITSVASSDKFYQTDKPIIVAAGKSNVGKSTFINSIAGNKKLARTSDTPGRTRLINYFDFGDFVLADLPGYGYAKVSAAEKIKWAKLLEDFFKVVKIRYVFSLIDIRHEPTEDDLDMVSFLYANAIPFSLVATKADKLGKSKIKPQVNKLAGLLKVAPKNILAVSSLNGYGREEVLSKIGEIISTKID